MTDKTVGTARDVIETILERPGVLDGLNPEERRYLAGGATTAILAALAEAGLVVVERDDVEYLTHFVADTLPKADPFWRTRSSIADRTARLNAALDADVPEDQP